MAHKVIVWGTGFTGKMVIRELLEHPAFELVGVIVNDPAKDGRDVGELLGLAPTGMKATRDVDAALAPRRRRGGLLRPDGRVRRGEHREHVSRAARREERGLHLDDAARLPEGLPAGDGRGAREGLPGGRDELLHHRHRPGLRERPAPAHAARASARASTRCASRRSSTTRATPATTPAPWGSAGRSRRRRCSRTRRSWCSRGATRSR